MKKLLKKINVFGLALILIGGVAIATQSAFTTSNKIDATTYYYYEIDDTFQWSEVPPTGVTCETSPGDQCSGIFNSAPNGYPATNYSSIVLGQLR